MPDTLLASGQAVYWIGAVMLIMARVGFIIYFMPGVGEQAVRLVGRQHHRRWGRRGVLLVVIFAAEHAKRRFER